MLAQTRRVWAVTRARAFQLTPEHECHVSISGEVMNRLPSVVKQLQNFCAWLHNFWCSPNNVRGEALQLHTGC